MSKKIQIFIFGLNKAGKSTLIEYFRERKFIPQSPTIGVSITQMVFSNLVLEFTDVGGQEAFRKQWGVYLQSPHILVFVIDALDRDESRIQAGKEELLKMHGNVKIQGVPLLILVNKIDSPLAMSKNIAIEKYGIESLKDRVVATYEVSAKTGENMDAVLNAMTSMVLKDEAIEYIINKELKEQCKHLQSSFKDFIQRGKDAFKNEKYYPALANFNIAKEINSNLFQLGVITSGKDYKNLSSLIAKAKKKLDEIEAKKDKIGPKKTNLARLRYKEALEVIEEDKIKTISLFLFGLDRAGKTTFVEFLKQEKFKDQTPTLGINIAHIVLGNVRFEFNDLGGQEAFRSGWMDYWKNQDLMIFMVDASDSARLSEARDALWSILNRSETQGKPLLVLLNKIDVPDSKSSSFIEQSLGLKQTQERTIGIYEISIKRNLNLEKALNFMVSLLLKDDVLEKFVTSELKRLIKNYRQMYNAYLKEAKLLEKEKNYPSAFHRVYKAVLIQKELFKHGIGKAQKEIKKGETWLAKLKKNM
ncbi:MAG: ADP-ribosylation factor-like protein [Candidatus Hodarchaeota archaeon]